MTGRRTAWLIGSATVAGLYLVLRKSATVSPQSYGEAIRVAFDVPVGWRRLTDTEATALPEIKERARALRNTPGFSSMQYGALAPFVASDGKTYATWVEQHYHPPGGTAKPWGLHHGVTLLLRL